MKRALLVLVVVSGCSGQVQNSGGENVAAESVAPRR